MKDLMEMVNTQWEDVNEGLKYANVYERGFYTVKLTPSTAKVEYYHISPDDLISTYEIGRKKNSNGITAAFFCGVQLISISGKPGSLEEGQECNATSFLTTRPPFWGLNLSPQMKMNTSDDEVEVKSSCSNSYLSSFCLHFLLTFMVGLYLIDWYIIWKVPYELSNQVLSSW